MKIPRPASLLAVLGRLGCLWLAQAALAQPLAPNDPFANCTPLAGPDGLVAGSNVGATAEPGEPPNGPWPLYGPTVWWCWTAPSNGCFYFSTEGSGFDTVLCVFTGTAVGSLTTVGCNDDFPGLGVASRVEFAARVGDSFKVRVDGYNGAQENIILRWDFSRPANDYFTNATLISGPSGAVSGNNCGATAESWERPNGPQPLFGRTVWWEWRAPADGAYEFTTAGSSFDTILCEFTVFPIGAAFPNSCNDDSFGLGTASRLTVVTTAGTLHFFRVDGYNGQEGTIRLNWGAASSFAGLVYYPLGAATTVLASNRLDIANVGPGGGDGVRIELGRSEGWQGSFRSLDLSPANTMLHIVARENVSGPADRIVGRLRIYCSSNSAVGAAADFSYVGSATSTVEVRDRLGDVVSRFSVPNDTALTFQPVNPADMPIPCLNSFILEQGRPTVWCRVCRPVSVWIPEAGGAGMSAIEMASYCIFADAPLAPVPAISSIELTGEGLGSFTLDDEALRMSGRFHRNSGPRGSTLMSGRCNEPGGPLCGPFLTFHWIDPDPCRCQAQLVIDLGIREVIAKPARSFFTDLVTGNGSAVATQPGAYLRLLASGNLGGVSKALGELRMTRGASNWTMTADYTPVGSMSQRVELYIRGMPVARFAGHVGIVARIPELPEGCGKGNPFPWPPGDPCFLCRWLQPQLITIPGVPGGEASFMADEIRVLAENPSASLRYLESFTIETGGLPSFSLGNETALPAVLAPLQISRQANGVLITIQTEVNRTYELQYTAVLDDGTLPRPWPPPNRWRLLQTIQGNGLMQTVFDPIANGGIAGGGCRFYWLRAPVGNGLQ